MHWVQMDDRTADRPPPPSTGDDDNNWLSHRSRAPPYSPHLGQPSACDRPATPSPSGRAILTAMANRTGPLTRRLRSPYDADIARLAVPALGTLVAEPLYVLADTAIVGRLGTNELAGLALASTVLLSVHALVIFLAYGTTASVARLVGAGRDAEAARQSLQGLWLAVVLGVIAVAVIGLTDQWLLRILGGDGEPLVAATRYLRISLAGMPFMFLALAGAGAFNGRQDTTTPLIITVAGALANLVIEVVLITFAGYGIGASALATVIAQVATGLVFGWRIVGWCRTAGVGLAPSPSAIGELAWLGRALVLRSIGLRGSFTLAAAVAARIGTAPLAAYQIGIQIWSTLALALDAVAIAGQALTGKWLGAGSAEKAKAAAKRMIELDVAVGAVMAVAVIVVREPVARVFSTDPEVIGATAAALIWVAVMQPLNGYVFALDGILIGAGDMTFLGRSMVASGLVFAAEAWWLLSTGRSLNWLWAALAVFMATRAIMLWIRWRSDRWLILGAGR